MKAKKFKIPIYFGDLIVIVSDDFKEVEKKYKLSSTHGFDSFTWVDEDKSGYSLFYVAIKGDTDSSVIAHEALHIVGDIFRSRNIKMDIDNDEPQCYLLGWVVSKINSVK